MGGADKPERGVPIALGLAVAGAAVLAYVLAPMLSSDSDADSFVVFAGVLLFLLAVAGAAYGVKKKY
jgi:hypothetical protein